MDFHINDLVLLNGEIDGILYKNTLGRICCDTEGTCYYGIEILDLNSIEYIGFNLSISLYQALHTCNDTISENRGQWIHYKVIAPYISDIIDF